jgi:cytochrome c
MRFRQFAPSLAAAVLTMSATLLVQDNAARSAAAEDGQVAFNNACRTCHSLKADDNRLGPNLHHVVGRKAGSVPNYNYSSAMKNAGLVWDKATLDRYIANPDEVVAGNSMKPYGGIASAEERAKIIDYLQSEGGG